MAFESASRKEGRQITQDMNKYKESKRGEKTCRVGWRYIFILALSLSHTFSVSNFPCLTNHRPIPSVKRKNHKTQTGLFRPIRCWLHDARGFFTLP